MKFYLIIFLIVLINKLSYSKTLNHYNDNDCNDKKLKENKILFLPLDERFTTRNAFINLIKVTPFCILTPDLNLLPSLKNPPNLKLLHNWVDENIKYVNTAIISSEMFLYGGLINSRISNDSTNSILLNLNKLTNYNKKYNNLKIYLSNVVMRIPAYNGDFEEPWYWENYGYNLYSYSYYTDKAIQENDKESEKLALEYQNNIPPNALNEFIWRRERNHNITLQMINYMNNTNNCYHYLYITLDDNALYGFNIREADELINLIASDDIDDNIKPFISIYPGADEVQLTLLSRFSNDYMGLSISNENENESKTKIKNKQKEEKKQSSSFIFNLGVVYRDPTATTNVPNYEGQSMETTLMQQIAAAGDIKVIILSKSNIDNNDIDNIDAILLVNNFSSEQQKEAADQPTSSLSSQEIEYDYSNFNIFIEKYLNLIPIGFCDNRYSNGADSRLIEYMQTKVASSQLKSITYAGWNTNGNTIGTVVSNTILLTLFNEKIDIIKGNIEFNSLRIVEDDGYQAQIRQDLNNYVSILSDVLYPETTSYLVPDLEFYNRFAFKQLASYYYNSIAKIYNTSFYQLDSMYYPWNRTFEAGFFLNTTTTTLLTTPSDKK